MSFYEALDHDLAEVFVRRSFQRSLHENLVRCPGMRSWSVDIVLFVVKKDVPAAAVLFFKNLMCYCCVPVSY